MRSCAHKAGSPTGRNPVAPGPPGTQQIERSVMPEYAPGTPSWVELSSRDADASAAFYGELMGWNAAESGSPEETGGYRLFQQGRKSGGGLVGPMTEGGA